MPFFRGFISKAWRKNKVSQNISKKGGGTPNPFTVSQMPFFRGRHLKSLFFASFFKILIKSAPWPP
jgi:hypothetical protein